MSRQWQAVSVKGARMCFGVSAPDYDTAWEIAAENLPDMPAEDGSGFKFEVTEITAKCGRHRVRRCGLCSADREQHQK